MRRHQNLQPWLDYFAMLRTNEEKGFLEMKVGDHEAYVTQPALLAMSPTDDPVRAAGAVPATILGIRAYAAFRSQTTDYLRQTFAVHVVKDSEPHDLLYTLLITRRRSWRSFFCKTDHLEMITY